ncbi:MAG: hypothetical protein J0M12_07820 [Deltaproteobacteria bacterium]|nr:hypothetical protein [Deltaproteobacteria bacterium]
MPNRPNALDLAKPVIADTVVRSGAYCSRLPLTSPCSANFRDMLDIQFSLGVAQTRALVKRVRRAATLLAEHCESKGIVAQAWKSRVGYARLSNPYFATRVILQGAAAEVREGYGEQLLKQWRKSPDPLTLIDRALGGGGMVSKFLDAMVKGVPGDFGEGRLVWSRTTADRADRTHALAGQA